MLDEVLSNRKPSRWTTYRDGSESNWKLPSVPWGVFKERYYRRLVFFYLQEARRWHKVALRSPEVQQAYEVLGKRPYVGLRQRIDAAKLLQGGCR